MATRPQIGDWVDATTELLHYGWLGTPKRLTFICGSCQSPVDLKAGSASIATITNMNRRLAGWCPSCKTWNLTRLRDA